MPRTIVSSPSCLVVMIGDDDVSRASLAFIGRVPGHAVQLTKHGAQPKRLARLPDRREGTTASPRLNSAAIADLFRTFLPVDTETRSVGFDPLDGLGCSMVEADPIVSDRPGLSSHGPIDPDRPAIIRYRSRRVRPNGNRFDAKGAGPHSVRAA